MSEETETVLRQHQYRAMSALDLLGELSRLRARNKATELADNLDAIFILLEKLMNEPGPS